ncbi:hypothetical protein ABZ860_21805 [Microbispora sp. NPDC046973]|uniref:hypothetical protein n=1 Tax=Microbispora sp. NPDC046973 TaxID=3155022 RepID=UPI0033F0F78A
MRAWLLEGLQTDRKEIEHGPHAKHPWWRVMCLTGVDYFSTLGYQPGIAALAAGFLSPLATVFLVALTLLGALPVYRRVAAESPYGQGSIAMLEKLAPQWWGKLFVLALLGFAATDFVITMTLSAADATAHILENPFAPHWLEGQRVPVTLFLLALLGGVFLMGFTEAIGIAVILVLVYLALNAVVVVTSIVHVLQAPQVVVDWTHALDAGYSGPLAMIGLSLLVMPKLALGMSGFETGVAVMPMVRGDVRQRIKGTKRLLTVAALVMSVFLIFSSFVTTARPGRGALRVQDPADRELGRAELAGRAPAPPPRPHRCGAAHLLPLGRGEPGARHAALPGVRRRRRAPAHPGGAAQGGAGPRAQTPRPRRLVVLVTASQRKASTRGDDRVGRRRTQPEAHAADNRVGVAAQRRGEDGAALVLQQPLPCALGSTSAIGTKTCGSGTFLRYSTRGSSRRR